MRTQGRSPQRSASGGYDGFVVTLCYGEGIPAATPFWTEGVEAQSGNRYLRRRKNAVAWP